MYRHDFLVTCWLGKGMGVTTWHRTRASAMLAAYTWMDQNAPINAQAYVKIDEICPVLTVKNVSNWRSTPTQEWR